MITDICIGKPRSKAEYDLIKVILSKRRIEYNLVNRNELAVEDMLNEDDTFNLNCFSWSDSKEGWDFWSMLSNQMNSVVELSLEVAFMWNKEFSQDINFIKRIEESNVYEITNLGKVKYFIKIERE